MSAADLPAPLVPAEVDLRGLAYMPLLGDRLFGSDFDLDADDTAFRVGLRLWWAAWKQVPAASLPREDSRLCKLAGLGENPAKWRKVRASALHGFVECSDGRLYHPVVAEQALIAWEKRVDDKAEREGDAARKAREREERAAMFAALKAAGITPKWNTGTTELRRLCRQHVTPTSHGEPPPPVTPPVTVTVTAKTGRDDTGIPKEGRSGTAAAVAREPAREDEPPEPVEPPPPPAPPAPPAPPSQEPPPDAQPTAAGLACRAMRQAGVQDVNPSHPTLQKLLAAGVPVATFGDTAREAVGKNRGRFAYVLTTVENRLAEAAAAGKTPAAAPAAGPDLAAWRKTADGVRRMAAQLGMAPPRDGETWIAYEGRVAAAWRRHGQPQPATAEAA